jgi:hypothetical protein
MNDKMEGGRGRRSHKTFYVDNDVEELLCAKSDATGKSFSDLVNEAVCFRFQWSEEMAKLFQDELTEGRKAMRAMILGCHVEQNQKMEDILEDRHKEQNGRIDLHLADLNAKLDEFMAKVKEDHEKMLR